MNTPAQIADLYLEAGKKKVRFPAMKMLILGIFAGAFIGFGGLGATVASVGVKSVTIGKLLGACIFPGGLAMVLLAGSELFTGNCLLVIPLLQKEIKCREMLKNWFFVYLGNMTGGMLLGLICTYAHQFSYFENGMAVSVTSIAIGKCSLSFQDAFLRGILCNFLVCIAVWISFAATKVTGKIMGIFFPIMIFVLCGFEHCVANMYYIPAGIFAKSEYAKAISTAGLDTAALTWKNYFIANLVPVTLGNIVGGALLVGVGYWLVYQKGDD